MKQKEIKALLQEIDGRIAAGEVIDMASLLQSLPPSQRVKEQFAKRANWTWMDFGYDTYPFLIDILGNQLDRCGKASVFHVIQGIRSIVDDGEMPVHWKTARAQNAIKEVIRSLYEQGYISIKIKGKWLDSIPVLPKRTYIRISYTKSTSLKTFLQRAARAFRGRAQS